MSLTGEVIDNKVFNTEPRGRNIENLKVIKRSNKLLEASNLPNILIVNPRSVYNKLTQLKSFIKEHNLDLICLSETWERNEEPLSKVLAMHF